MRRYTTPTLPMTVPVDLTGAEIHVTIKQGARKIVKTGECYVVARAGYFSKFCTVTVS